RYSHCRRDIRKDFHCVLLFAVIVTAKTVSDGFHARTAWDLKEQHPSMAAALGVVLSVGKGNPMWAPTGGIYCMVRSFKWDCSPPSP
ncbi:hypothetical protein BHE74_00030108, partial [Ensete ventricosum]